MEGADRKKGDHAPLDDWQPPTAWRLGAHAEHLRNLYVYFWRWAARKVFEDLPGQAAGGGSGIVAFITVAGYLSGPGFERMRQDLRQRCDEIWVIDCSPEGHQPEVSTRIFQGVMQPVCIVMATRWRDRPPGGLARVRWRALPRGHRDAKFAALADVKLTGLGWQDCPEGGRTPFLPASVGAWATYPKLQDLFGYNGSGVMPGRTWVIAPDPGSLTNRWTRLQAATPAEKKELFHPHMVRGQPGDRHSNRIVREALFGFPERLTSVAADAGEPLPPIRYAYRSFDRQWILPDVRLLNRPNPQLWKTQSDQQVFLTVFTEESPTRGPALTVSGLIPDLHHYKGSFGGRAFPLWADAESTRPNVNRQLMAHLSAVYGAPVSAEDVFAYIAAVAAQPAYIERFRNDLATPGLHIPLTADANTFASAVALGRRVVWLHTFGERFADAAAGRPAGAPRLPVGQRPQVPVGGAIPNDADNMPDSLSYDVARQRLTVGTGNIEPVPPAVWRYEVSGKQVLVQWFSYRRKHRERPVIGDRRKPSALGDIQPDSWPAEYTTELLNVLNVLGLLVALEPEAAALLARICDGPLIANSALDAAGVFFPEGHVRATAPAAQTTLEGFEG